MSNYKASPISRKDIRRLVKFIREITGYSNTLNFPIVKFVELFLPQVMPDFELEIIPYEDMKNTCGETKPSESRIILNEAIYEKAIKNDGFARLTIAHEIGHLLLHNNNSITLCKLKPNEKLKPFEDPEWQADAFGGELLAPSYLIKDLTIDDIAEKCGVTKRTASVQKSKI